METIKAETNVNFRLCGLKNAVLAEYEKQLSKLNYEELGHNITINKIDNLVRNTLSFTSPVAAIELIVNISFFDTNAGVKDSTETPMAFKTVEVAVRPLWGFCA